jgi:hypothetical protein
MIASLQEKPIYIPPPFDMSFRAFLVLSGIILLLLLSSSESFHVRGRVSSNRKNIVPFHSSSSSSSSSTSPVIGFSDSVAQKEDEEKEKEFLKRRLPPVKRQQMSKFEIEFRELLEGILYTESEIEAVVNPRLRAILEGISASYYEPAVYRAFEVLYEDYMPLRIAGRMVYRRLRDVMEESRKDKQSQIKTVIETTGLSRTEAESCWSTFIRMGESQRLSLKRLKMFIGKTTYEYFDVETVEEAMDRICLNGESDSLSFDQLMVGILNNGSKKLPRDVEQHSKANVLQQILDKDRILRAEGSDFSSRLDSKHRRYNDRYDDMLEQFGRWKTYIPDGEGRRLDILRGCFVGSENPAVIEALRIIYVDYSALRLSGDWIFKVVSTIMGSVERRRVTPQS